MNYYRIILSSILLFAIDSIYLTLFKGYFSRQIQLVQHSTIKLNILSAVMCYIFLIFGLNYFILEKRKGVLDAFLLGLVIYGVYETTNHAIFSKWSILTVIIDTLWGGILFALTTGIIKHFFIK